MDFWDPFYIKRAFLGTPYIKSAFLRLILKQYGISRPPLKQKRHFQDPFIQILSNPFPHTKLSEIGTPRKIAKIYPPYIKMSKVLNPLHKMAKIYTLTNTTCILALNKTELYPLFNKMFF